MLDPKFLGVLQRHVAPAPRHVLFVTGSRTFDARPDGKQWFLNEYAPVAARVPAGTLFVSGACPDSPDMWGWNVLCFQLRKDRASFEGLLMRATGDYGFYSAQGSSEPVSWGRVISDWWGRVLARDFNGPGRNAAMAEALSFLSRLGCTVECHAFRDGHTQGTDDMIEQLTLNGFPSVLHDYAASP